MKEFINFDIYSTGTRAGQVSISSNDSSDSKPMPRENDQLLRPRIPKRDLTMDPNIAFGLHPPVKKIFIESCSVGNFHGVGTENPNSPQ